MSMYFPNTFQSSHALNSHFAHAMTFESNVCKTSGNLAYDEKDWDFSHYPKTNGLQNARTDQDCSGSS